MPPVGRTCSECNGSLAGKSVTAKTCSDNCRLKRSRRIRRSNREIQEFAENNNAGASEIAAIVRREAPDVVTKVMKEHLAPVVREALTEDVLRSIHEMVGLTPKAVAALHDDLESEDSTIRQRAYTLLIKYTVGHPALVKQDDTEGGQQMIVNMGVPRPTDEALHSVTDAEVVEDLVCDTCGEEKPPDQFESGSTRCTACFEEWKTRVLEQFA